jgi:delta(3,5)-delta(2,4)-dienoyl-CoA isomerase
MAETVGSKAPIATLGTKHLLLHSRDHSVSDGLQYTKVWNSVMLNSKDTINAALGTLQKQPVLFPKL